MTTPSLAPLAGIVVRTPRLVLRLPDATEILALADVARDGVHPPDRMPFLVPWTDEVNSPGFLDDFAAYHHGLRRDWTPESWALELGVFLEGTLVGAQALRGTRFRETRTVVSGSWLGSRHQGRGIGTEMRAAILELAFAGLGAAVAESGALEGNDASACVSAKLGYLPDGEKVVHPRGRPVRERRFRLTADRWTSPVPVEIEGLAECLPLFGLGGD